MIERYISQAEDALSNAAFFPIAGTFPALAKVAMGVVQAVTALALTILLFLPAMCNRSATRLCLRAFSHVKHGAGNILAGAFEAIPFVGTAISIFRQHRTLCPMSLSESKARGKREGSARIERRDAERDQKEDGDDLVGLDYPYIHIRAPESVWVSQDLKFLGYKSLQDPNGLIYKYQRFA